MHFSNNPTDSWLEQQKGGASVSYARHEARTSRRPNFPLFKSASGCVEQVSRPHCERGFRLRDALR
jgi:hypothetical protein